MYNSADVDTWSVSGVMSIIKSGSSDCAVNSVPEIIMNGGIKMNSSTINHWAWRSTINTQDGKDFGYLPLMPSGFFSHCVVALDDSDLFVTGGFVHDFLEIPIPSDKSFLYHSDTGEWEELQGVPTLRLTPMCSMVHKANGEQEVIVAGGTAPENYESRDVVEIYNLQSKEWRLGKNVLMFVVPP